MNYSDSETVQTRLDESGVLHVTLNRPKRKNAFNDEQWDALAATLNRAKEDRAVAVVLLSGAGGNFSSGVDLASFGGGAPAARSDGFATAFHACESALLHFDKPLVAAVNGVAVGGGCTIALACDLTYIGEGVRMRLPFANLGLVPEIASSYTLQANIGRQRAAELMLTAEWIDAARAMEMGLAARCLPDAEVESTAMEKAKQIAQWPTSSLRAIKQTLRATDEAGIARALEIESRLMSELAGSPENIEAVKAFMEKRDPDFRQFRK